MLAEPMLALILVSPIWVSRILVNRCHASLARVQRPLWPGIARPRRGAHPPAGARALLLALCLGIATTAGDAAAEGFSRTPSVQTRIGMWYQPDAPLRERLWKAGDPGEPLFLKGRVIDVHGKPVAGALVEVWHADPDGFVDTGQFRSRLKARADGSFRLVTVLPGYIFGPRHIHFRISQRQHPPLVTRVFFKRDPVIALHDYPAVIVVLEDGTAHGRGALFGSVEFVMSPG